MIGLEYFDPHRPEAERIIAAVTKVLDSVTGRRTSVRLAPQLDPATRERLMRLNTEVFGREGEVFDRRGLGEVEADPDALFVLLEIDGSVEACCFGYYEEPGKETVVGTDFFLDTGMVSPAWQDRGVGELGGFGLLLLLSLLGDVHEVGVAAWNGGRVEDLVTLYRRFGFVDAVGRGTPHRCLKVSLDGDRVAQWRATLGLPEPAGSGS